MKFKEIFIASCALFALGTTGAGYAQTHCPETITCSSDNAASCRSSDSNWQATIPMVTVKKDDSFQFIYAYYNGGIAKCGYKRTSDNSITLSVESTKFAPAKSSGWPPAINGGARTCGSPNNPQSATSCPWETR